MNQKQYTKYGTPGKTTPSTTDSPNSSPESDKITEIKKEIQENAKHNIEQNLNILSDKLSPEDYEYVVEKLLLIYEKKSSFALGFNAIKSEIEINDDTFEPLFCLCKNMKGYDGNIAREYKVDPDTVDSLRESIAGYAHDFIINEIS